MKSAIGGVRIRESVWDLPQWDDTLLWYARAMKEMWPRALDDPTSWRFQAAIHGYDPTNSWLIDLVQPGDRLPANHRDVWNQCQHGSWFFLPWHRGYLGCFETIVRETIRGLGGPADDWALPYWDYSDSGSPHAKLVRPEFVEPGWPDAGANPLAVGVQRGPSIAVATPMGNARDFGLDVFDVSLAALNEREFTVAGNASSFGGGETGFSFSGSVAGALERTPHGDVHMAVGFDQRTRSSFWMGAFETAGLDPIFWLHHCNLDRLWTQWLARSGVSGNPTSANWRQPASAVTGELMPFILYHPTAANFRFVPEDMISSATSIFAYRYDDEPAPVRSNMFENLTNTFTKAIKLSKEPDLIGATRSPVQLDGGRATATVTLEPAARKGLFSSLLREARPRTYLSLENIVAEGAAIPYRVYLTSPATPEGDAEQFVGTLPMFGVVEASRADSHTGGSGLSYVFDVTDVVANLGDQQLEVVLTPKSAGGAAGIKVGKISFYRR